MHREGPDSDGALTLGSAGFSTGQSAGGLIASPRARALRGKGLFLYLRGS